MFINLNNKQIKIAIASGKGGTGKTTFALNLALLLDDDVTLIDSDVEAPNLHLFFNKDIVFDDNDILAKHFFDRFYDFYVKIPKFDESKCNGCKICKSICKFNAITLLLNKTVFFYELCHYCELCFNVCPNQAILPENKTIGTIYEKQINDNLKLISGFLKVNEAKSSPLIKELVNNYAKSKITIIDSPPGTSCSMISAVYKADIVILVTEPTNFGLHDLQLAVDALRQLNKKFKIVINKFEDSYSIIKNWCDKQNIEIIGIIPFNIDFAKTYSEGNILVYKHPYIKELFKNIIDKILKEVIK